MSDVGGIGGIISGIVGGVVDIGNMVGTFIQQGYERDISERNYEQSQKAYADQERWNDLNWTREAEWRQQDQLREDTAVQRRAADLKAAGLSPVLAAGQGAQSSHMSSTLNRVGAAPQQEASRAQPRLDLSNLAIAAQMMKMKQDVSLSESQKQLVEAQAEQARAQAANAHLQNEIDRYDFDIYKRYKVPVRADTASKQFLGVEGIGSTIVEKVREMYGPWAEKRAQEAAEKEEIKKQKQLVDEQEKKMKKKGLIK